jgi:hypothetical protein
MAIPEELTMEKDYNGVETSINDKKSTSLNSKRSNSIGTPSIKFESSKNEDNPLNDQSCFNNNTYSDKPDIVLSPIMEKHEFSIEFLKTQSQKNISSFNMNTFLHSRDHKSQQFDLNNKSFEEETGSKFKDKTKRKINTLWKSKVETCDQRPFNSLRKIHIKRSKINPSQKINEKKDSGFDKIFAKKLLNGKLIKINHKHSKSLNISMIKTSFQSHSTEKKNIQNKSNIIKTKKYENQIIKKFKIIKQHFLSRQASPKNKIKNLKKVNFIIKNVSKNKSFSKKFDFLNNRVSCSKYLKRQQNKSSSKSSNFRENFCPFSLKSIDQINSTEKSGFLKRKKANFKIKKEFKKIKTPSSKETFNQFNIKRYSDKRHNFAAFQKFKSMILREQDQEHSNLYQRSKSRTSLEKNMRRSFLTIS